MNIIVILKNGNVARYGFGTTDIHITENYLVITTRYGKKDIPLSEISCILPVEATKED